MLIVRLSVKNCLSHECKRSKVGLVRQATSDAEMVNVCHVGVIVDMKVVERRNVIKEEASVSFDHQSWRCCIESGNILVGSVSEVYFICIWLIW